MKVEKKYIEKPWGQEIIWAQNDHYVGKIINIHHGKRLSKQYHKEKDETIIVLSGELLLQISVNRSFTVTDDKNIKKTINSVIVDEEIILHPGQSYHIVPGTIHRFVANESDVSLIEVSTPQLKDVVRLEDDFDRNKN